jgi:hypothetical protein
MAKGNQNSVLICWNECEFANKLKTQVDERVGNNNTIVCTNSDDLKNILDEKSNQITHIIVLCELKWLHEINDGAYSNMNGIKLVQYLRSIIKIELPVLFVSFLKREEIIVQKGDREIISTPAFKHYFVDIFDLMKKINKDWEKFINAKPMPVIDLHYTIINFCGEALRRILHSISSCSSLSALTKELHSLEGWKNQMSEELYESYLKIKTLIGGCTKDIEKIKKIILETCNDLLNPRDYDSKPQEMIRQILHDINSRSNASDLNAWDLSAQFDKLQLFAFCLTSNQKENIISTKELADSLIHKIEDIRNSIEKLCNVLSYK